MTDHTYHCPAGSFTGYSTEHCIHIKGIRYAESERFASPVPYVYPRGIHVCTEDSPYAVQLRSAAEGNISGMDYENQLQEESCQYLSLTLPNDIQEEEQLPVMVWIHGGAFRNGGCDSISYDRERLACENHVIVLGLNYRLGILGFVRDPEGNYSNAGLLDLIEGLKWIQTNISGFHGNPDNITLFGQSAGAEAIRCLMLADGTDGLFHKCILQSDPVGTMNNREEMEKKILEEVNAMDPNASLDEVRRTQASVVEHVTEKGLAKYMIFGPHFGISPLPDISELPARMKKAAEKYDILMGTNTREVSAYLVNSKPCNTLYNCILTRWMIEAVVHTLSRKIFISPSEQFAAQMKQAGADIYQYSLSYGDGISFIGACHMMDYLPLFGADHLKLDITKMGMDNDEIAEKGRPVRKIWADFAKTGTITVFSVPDMIQIRKL